MEHSRPLRFIRCPEVEHRTGKGRSTIYASIKRGNKRFDPTFPTPIRIGPGSVAWVESEVDDWIKSRIDQRAESLD